LQGTWQFISAELLRDPQRIQTIEDDRESAIHVLTWLALRYTKHDRLDIVSSYLAIYDQVDHGFATGGIQKGNEFFSSVFPKFTSGPLNRLLAVVRKHFSARYGKTYSDEEVREVREYVAARKYNPIYGYLPPYIYGSHMEALKKSNWLVEVFNKHLGSDDWPLDDKAVANDPSRVLGFNSKGRRC
jgi:hypothetical protein